MSETDELVKRLRAHPNPAYADRNDQPMLDEAADRLEAQATALTASQETIDAQQARIAELEGALVRIADVTSHDMGLNPHEERWIHKEANAALAKHDTDKEGA